MNNNALLRLRVSVQNAWANFRESEKGQTMVEYAGIAIVVGAIIVAIVSFVGSDGAGLPDAVIGKVRDALDKFQ